ncbi:MAG: lipoate--protein ligase [Desulfovibrio sp.]|jgi:lipoate-protein ligase A|nr:lipoate--protein ligase [Desulfovibrio sp.]
MLYLENDSVDPHYNLALEQYVFDILALGHSFFMLWRNRNAIIVGKHQNTVAEINADFVKKNNIHVVRRLSGGGAVYHDLGNVNFTFITQAGVPGAFDFASFCRPVLRALAELGVEADINGRNDMTIDGRKFSGNAQYYRGGRVLHHGTILYDSNLSIVGEALVIPKDKIESKGLTSIRSRVTNVKAYMLEKIPVERFMAILQDSMLREFRMEKYSLTPKDIAAVQKLRKEVYDTWEWNYGASPVYSITRERRVDDVGKISVYMNIKQGVIGDIAFFGDYFGNADAAPLALALTGCRRERGALSRALENINVGSYFHNLDQETFLDILAQ